MNSRAEQMYSYLPVGLQNCAISLQGWRFRRARFGPHFDEALARAKAVAGMSKDEIAAYQLHQLQLFVAHAYNESPYYRKKYDTAGVHPLDLKSIEDLAVLPVLEKNELRRHTGAIQARSTLMDTSLQHVSTSGTTGTPINVAFTLEDMRQRFATLYRMFARFGIDPFDRAVRFSGRTLFPRAEENRTFWRLNYPQNQLLMSTYHMSGANLDEYVQRLEGFKPRVIDGYPSAIYILSRHINRRGWQGRVLPIMIMTTAETLEDFQRSEMLEAFPGVRIANQYASSEGAPFITEDEFGDLVINSDTGVFEIDGGGSSGEILVTSFTTHAFPLIRYRIGDRMELAQGILARSMAMPLARSILGRQEDLIISPDRGPVGRLDPVFKKMPSTILESQIEQVSADEVVLRIVPDKLAGYNASQVKSVVGELQARLGAMTVSVEETESLKRGLNGKLRTVVGFSMRDF